MEHSPAAPGVGRGDNRADWLGEDGSLGLLNTDDRLFIDRFLQAGDEGALQEELDAEQEEEHSGLRLRGAASTLPEFNDTADADAPSSATAAVDNHRTHIVSTEEPLRPSGSAESAEEAGDGGSRSGSGGSVQAGKAAQGKPRGKRKLPVPDLESIEDPAERRKQRRLLKNRNTAAASRERKQRELEALTERTAELERDNEVLKRKLDTRDNEIEALNAEVARLSGQPHNPSGGGGGGSCGGPVAQRAASNSGGEAVVPGRPLPPPPPGQAPLGGMPGLVVGMDGQWVRLQPGFKLPEAASASQQQQQQQQQQARRSGQQQRRAGVAEAEDEEEELDEGEEDAGSADDSDWEPGWQQGRGRGSGGGGGRGGRHRGGQYRN